MKNVSRMWSIIILVLTILSAISAYCFSEYQRKEAEKSEKKAVAQRDSIQEDLDNALDSISILKSKNDFLHDRTVKLVNLRMNDLKELTDKNQRIVNETSSNLHELLNFTTGGDGYCYVKFFKIKNGKEGLPLIGASIINDSSYPNYNLQINIIDLDKVDKCKKKIIKGETFIDRNDFLKSVQTFRLDVVPPNESIRLSKYLIPLNEFSSKIIVEIYSLNGKVEEKIEIIFIDRSMNIGYRVEKNGKILKTFFSNDNNEGVFKWDFGMGGFTIGDL